MKTCPAGMRNCMGCPSLMECFNIEPPKPTKDCPVCNGTGGDKDGPICPVCLGDGLVDL